MMVGCRCARVQIRIAGMAAIVATLQELCVTNCDTSIIGKSGMNPAPAVGWRWVRGTIDVKRVCLIDHGADVNAVCGAVSLRFNREEPPLPVIHDYASHRGTKSPSGRMRSLCSWRLCVSPVKTLDHSSSPLAPPPLTIDYCPLTILPRPSPL